MKYLTWFLFTLALSRAQFNPEQLESRHFWDQLPDEPVYWKGVLQNIHDFLKLLKSSSFPTAVAKNISQQCTDDSVLYVHSYYNLSLWALQMHESTGQYPEGLIGSLQLHAMGLFDECLAVNAPTFRGKYCTVYFGFTDAEPISAEDLVDGSERGSWITFFQWLELLGLIAGGEPVKPQVSDVPQDLSTLFMPSIAFCIPSSCSANDFRTAVSQIVGGISIGNQSVITVSDESACFVQNDDAPQFDGPDIAVLVTLSTIGLLVVLATLYESCRLMLNRPIDVKDPLPVRALHCFSAINNGRKLLSTKSSGSDNLSCVHGIRFLSTTWVIMGHHWSQPLSQPNYSRFLLVQDAYKWEMQGIINATVSVDSFYLLSGMLVSYLLLKELDKNKGRFNIILFYVHRYLRLTPVYAIILGFIATLMVYMGSGPLWLSVRYTATGCRNGWWYNLLYINNLVSLQTDELCMGETWYLATDMQMFLLSPLVIYPMWRWKKPGRFWWLTLLIAATAGNFVVYALNDLPATLIPTRTQDNAADFTYDYYTKPWFRVPPYLIGIYLGYYLNKTKNARIKIPKGVVVTGWAISAAAALAIIYGLSDYLHADDEMTTATRIFYGSLHRTAWAMALSWVIFACTKGYGGFVNNLLSWGAFMPLSRLTYCAFLIHLNFIILFYGYMRKPMYYTAFNHVHSFLGLLMIVFGLSFIVSVTVEAPFLNLEKLMFSPLTKRKTPAVAGQDGHVRPISDGKANNGFVPDQDQS